MLMKKKKNIVWYEINKKEILYYINESINCNRKYICTAWIKNNITDTYQYLIYKSTTKNESTFKKNISTLKCLRRLSQYELTLDKEYIAKQILTEYKKIRIEEEFE